MSMIPHHIGKAAWYALVIWLSGFLWSTLVLMIPFLRDIKTIPYISSNLAISFPILIIWIFLAAKLTRSYFEPAAHEANEALKLGLSFFIVNAVLDLLVLVIVLGHGPQFYLSLRIWLAYIILIAVPLEMGSESLNPGVSQPAG